MSTRNINVSRYEDEYALFGKALPYVAMLIGAGLVFVVGVITRIGIWFDVNYSQGIAHDSSVMLTWIVAISCILLCPIAWILFKKRQQFHPFIAMHAVITVIVVHAWFFMAIWQDMGEWMFGMPTAYTYFYGGIVVGLSWCIRRWAYREGVEESEGGYDLLKTIGLGHAKPQSGQKLTKGFKFLIDLDYGKTIEDAKKKLPEIAHILKKPRNQVHISETDSGVEGVVEVTVLDKDPFEKKETWLGPDYPGSSIVEPISFATYDTGERGIVYLAGKNGASSEHFLTMGMPGTGKSKVWQVIYGSALNRKDVSIIYGDPAKGMQTGGALASGLDWFAWTEADCQAQIKAVINAIPARTNYLTSRGLSHWQRDCGLNFLIFHLEEAARFAEVSDLIILLEAARSAGIAVVISLQRASHDRIPTSARYNLGANLCFGVKGKRDAEFGLSEYARESGATPHIWQNRFPGRFYLESSGIDQRLAGHPLQADWIDESFLQAQVDSAYRPAMDEATATALGLGYAAYRQQVEQQKTAWQEMRRNRNHQVDTKDWPVSQDTVVLTDNDLEQIDIALDEPTGVRPTNLQTDPEDTLRAHQEFENILRAWQVSGKSTFINKEVGELFTARKAPWISKKLTTMQKEGRIEKTPEGFWRIISL